MGVPNIQVFTAKHDPTANTLGADYIEQALGSHRVAIHRYDSNRHVIIETQAKQGWSQQDQRVLDDVMAVVIPLL